jgi:uncharacterized protein GlcG (DUF336 family)
MNKNELNTFIRHFFDVINELIPEYAVNPLDAFANGNVAVCVQDESGLVYGNIWGNDKIIGRQFFKNAWLKCSQVWITGMKTGEYERRLYNEEFSEEKFGINKPDLFGWEGGQPIALSDGTKLSIGFSGFRGCNDLEIVKRAIAIVEVKNYENEL